MKRHCRHSRGEAEQGQLSFIKNSPVSRGRARSPDVGRRLTPREPPPARLADQLVVVMAQLAQGGQAVVAPDHVEPRHLGPGPVGVTYRGKGGVTAPCAGVTVQPGDPVIGDHDGVVVLPPGLAPEILAALEQERQEEFAAA